MTRVNNEKHVTWMTLLLVGVLIVLIASQIYTINSFLRTKNRIDRQAVSQTELRLALVASCERGNALRANQARVVHLLLQSIQTDSPFADQLERSLRSGTIDRVDCDSDRIIRGKE